MKEGVFFPNFWPLTQIKTWLGHYGQLTAEQLAQLQFCNNKQQFYLDLRWLRQLYSSQRTEFDKMVLLFDLFGIVVQTEHNLGIFSKHESRLQTHVIIAEQNLSVKNLVQHHPLMSVLQLQPLLMNATNLFGLVLENLIQYNVTVSIDQLLMILHDCQIKVDIRTNQPGPLISEFFTDNVREQYIADILQKHNVTSVQQVTPAILLQEFANWHLKSTQQNQLLKKLKQQGWTQSIFPTPQQKIFTPLLPHLQGILDQRHYVISLSAYKQEIRQQIAATKHPRYQSLSKLVQ
ncbi:hypothetical protein EQ500_05875, partial [Lactobacillus sp. XV13L]|nr:hypothetical protein [Lactobacillus sp. XV13L]